MSKIFDPNDFAPEIRKFKERDLDRIKRIEKSAFVDYPWATEDFVIFLRKLDRGHQAYVAEWNDVIIGFLFLIETNWYYEIISVAVSKEFRRMGVAKSLIDFVKDKLVPYGREDIYARVKKSNPSARVFFQEQGFEIIDYEDKCYEDNKDPCLRMKYEMVELPLKEEYQHL